MDAVEFIKAKNRICEITECCCIKCILFECCEAEDDEKINQRVALAEQWALNNPIKTYKDVLLEKFSNARLNILCVCDVFGKQYVGADWDEEYKELS